MLCHLSPGSCHYHFKLTNHGQRTRRLYWRNDGFHAPTQSHKGVNISGQAVLPPISTQRKMDIPSQRSALAMREKPVFSLSPCRVELFAGCSVDMVLTGSSDSPQVVQERLMCHTIVDQQSSYDHIMSVDITCHFVTSMLSFSPKQLNFYIKKDLTPLYEKLLLTNVSTRSLSLELRLIEPFSLCESPGAHSSATTKVHVSWEQADVWVCFNPAYCLDRVSRVVDEVLEVCYQGHPQRDVVKLYTEVHFPSLHFSSTTVDFGCVLNNTQAHKQIWITNCSPLPVSYRWCHITLHIYTYGGDVTTLSNLLPEKLLTEILVERFQLSDCHRGIVIGALGSVFTRSAATTLQVILKALKNCKHIYVVNLSDSYGAVKARERAQRETEGKIPMSEMSATEKQVNFSFLYCTLYYTLGFAVKQLICDIWLRKLWPICGFCHSKLGRS
uniref:Hydin adenylate kinase-like domain-containing protein n=1 Tax=Mola mola TaxID=94237 RepID=A0A3Q3XB93_MOLML